MGSCGSSACRFQGYVAGILHAGFGSCPVKEVIYKFTKIVAPMFEKQRKLQKQNLELSEARDRLLPKLMSGELVV